MSLARIAHTKKKSLHTFDEEPFFINYKNLCRYRNMLSKCSSGTWFQILAVDLYIETVNNVEIEEKMNETIL